MIQIIICERCDAEYVHQWFEDRWWDLDWALTQDYPAVVVFIPALECEELDETD